MITARAPLLRQPGPRHQVRVHSHPVTVSSRLYEHAALAADLTDALWSQLPADAGAAVAELHGFDLDGVDYVMPALSRDPRRAVTFSSPRHDPGHARVVTAHVTMGWRGGDPYVHCHALWRTADGDLHGGHLLPEANSPSGRPFGLVHRLHGVRIEATPDAETGFTLLHPSDVEDQRHVSAPTTAGMFLRIRPNEDLIDTVEKLCLAEGYERAVVRASLGSLVGACFQRPNGERDEVPGPVVEVVTMTGRIAPDAEGVPRAQISGVVVDTRGQLYAGNFVPGANPVAVTFELALERLP